MILGVDESDGLCLLQSTALTTFHMLGGAARCVWTYQEGATASRSFDGAAWFPASNDPLTREIGPRAFARSIVTPSHDFDSYSTASIVVRPSGNGYCF